MDCAAARELRGTGPAGAPGRLRSCAQRPGHRRCEVGRRTGTSIATARRGRRQHLSDTCVPSWLSVIVTWREPAGLARALSRPFASPAQSRRQPRRISRSGPGRGLCRRWPGGVNELIPESLAQKQLRIAGRIVRECAHDFKAACLVELGGLEGVGPGLAGDSRDLWPRPQPHPAAECRALAYAYLREPTARQSSRFPPNTSHRRRPSARHCGRFRIAGSRTPRRARS